MTKEEALAQHEKSKQEFQTGIQMLAMDVVRRFLQSNHKLMEEEINKRLNSFIAKRVRTPQNTKTQETRPLPP